MLRRSLILSLALILSIAWPIPGNAQSNSDEMADLASDDLRALPTEISTVDEPGLRAFLRIRLASLLWKQGLKLTIAPVIAERVAKQAIDDLVTGRDEIPSLYLNSFRSELSALLRIHAPQLAEELTAKESDSRDDTANQLSAAQSLLREGKTDAALDSFRRVLPQGSVNPIWVLAFLTELERKKPEEIPKLLSELITVGEQKPGAVSLSALFWLNSFFLREANPRELRARFAAAVVAAAERNDLGSGEAEPVIAYQALTAVAPVVEQLVPSLNQRCRQLLVGLRSRVPETIINRDQANQRAGSESDRLDRLIAEARLSDDSLTKESLLTEAAQLAAEKGRLSLALEIALQISAEGDDNKMWRDQFLSQIVSKALKEKDPETANYAASKITARLDHASALAMLAKYHSASGDLSRARERLNEAIGLASADDNRVRKAKVLFDLAAEAGKIDEIRVSELISAGIKTINSIPSPNLDERRTGSVYRAYIESLLAAAWNTLPAFSQISARDYLQMRTLAAGIQNRGVKLCALFGALSGVIEASVAPAPASKKQT